MYHFMQICYKFIVRIQYLYVLNDLKYKSYFPGNNQDATEPWQPGNEWDTPPDPYKVRVECLRD